MVFPLRGAGTALAVDEVYMKLKNRLIISFLIITIVPVVIFSGLMCALKGIVKEATEEQLLTNEIINSFKNYMDDTGRFDELVSNFCIAEFIILLLTAIIMVVWIYRGIAPQLKILKVAAITSKKAIWILAWHPQVRMR